MACDQCQNLGVLRRYMYMYMYTHFSFMETLPVIIII